MELLRPFVILSVALLAPSSADVPTGDGEMPELRVFHHLCALKKDEGPCKALVERFYFDVETGRCELFDYGGCQGNDNNFESQEKCEEMCLMKVNKSPCHLEQEIGPCRGMVQRYFYNLSTRRCEHFFYGGCFGNANNFHTLEQCQAHCHGNGSEGMEAPGERSARKDGRAQPLTTTEPPPEKSPFIRLRHPKHPAGPMPIPCQIPAYKGTCSNTFKRYAYNSKMRRCQSFRYTGCGGNSNNFETKKDCVKTCIKDVNARINRGHTEIIFRSV